MDFRIPIMKYSFASKSNNKVMACSGMSLLLSDLSHWNVNDFSGNVANLKFVSLSLHLSWHKNTILNPILANTCGYSSLGKAYSYRGK